MNETQKEFDYQVSQNSLYQSNKRKSKKNKEIENHGYLVARNQDSEKPDDLMLFSDNEDK